MNIIAGGLGYRELGRIADFIRVIENGKKEFQDLVDHYDELNISYDVHADSVTIEGYNCPKDKNGKYTAIKGPTLYPKDIDIYV